MANLWKLHMEAIKSRFEFFVENNDKISALKTYKNAESFLAEHIEGSPSFFQRRAAKALRKKYAPKMLKTLVKKGWIDIDKKDLDVMPLSVILECVDKELATAGESTSQE